MNKTGDNCCKPIRNLLTGGKTADSMDVSHEGILENLNLFSFELTSEEMEQIAALDRGEKHDWY